METQYQVDRDKDFTQYQTFSWYSEDSTEPVNGAFGVNAEAVDNMIRDTIQKQLQSKSLSAVESNSADIWINYKAIAQSTLSNSYRYSLKDLNQSYRQKNINYSSSFDASRRFTTEYDEGQFIVDVIDRKDLQVVWRGMVELPLGLHKQENLKLKRMQHAVETLLARFPH